MLRYRQHLAGSAEHTQHFFVVDEHYLHRKSTGVRGQVKRPHDDHCSHSRGDRHGIAVGDRESSYGVYSVL